MDWDDLAYFVCLVEQQTLTASAEKLGVQHSTVSRRIERLESTLSLKLFNRLSKRYSLTQEGEHLYSQAIEVQKEIDTFERMAIDQNAMQGKVVISAPPVLANELLIEQLPAFRERYPGIVLHLRGDLNVSNLHRKEADIALRLLRPTQDDLLIRTIGHVHYGFFAHQQYVEDTPIEQWALIEFQGNSGLMDWLKRLVKQHAYQIILSSNDLYVTYSCVCANMGITILPYFLAAKDPDLVQINPLTKTIMTTDQIEEATRFYITTNIAVKANDRAGDTGKIASEGQRNISNEVCTIPLVQSKPLYVVMHPDVRRSARVSVVSEWLGSVFMAK